MSKVIMHRSARSTSQYRRIPATLPPAVLGVTLFCVLALCGAALWVGEEHHADPERTAYAVIHMLLAAVLITTFFGAVARHKIRIILFPAAASVVVHLLYFAASGLKYFSDNPMYAEFHLSLSTRFWYSMLAGVTIAGMVALVASRARRDAKRTQYDDMVVSTPLLVGLCAVYAVVAWILLERGFGSTYSSTARVTGLSYDSASSIALILLSSTLGDTLAAFIAVAMAHRITAARVGIACVFGVGHVYWLLVVRQQRTGLMILAVIILLALQLRRPHLGARWLQVGVAITPVAAVVLAAIMLLAMGRETAPGIGTTSDEVAYRLDLSDFAVSVGRVANIKSGMVLIGDAFLNVVPAVFLGETNKTYLTRYGSIMTRAGLGSDVDYGDTLFSAGAMVLGPLGFVLWPLCYIAGLGALTSRLLAWRASKRGYQYMAIAITVGALNIELGWGELFLVARLLLIFGIPIGALFAFAARSRTAKANTGIAAQQSGTASVRCPRE